MKINIKNISAMLIGAMLVSIMPLCTFAESSFVKVDIKSQANGLLYMDNHNEPATYNKNQFGDNDFLPYSDLGRSNLEAMITSERDLFSSVAFDGENIPLDITEKRTGTDVTDKEAIILQPSKTSSFEVDIPDGNYNEFYVAFSSMVKSSGTPSMNIDLNYHSGTQMVTRTVYGKSTSDGDIEDAVQISGRTIEMLIWNNLQGSYPVNTKHYVYKITTDSSEALGSIGFTVSDCAVAIIGMTGKLDIDTTKVYVENILAEGNAVIAENVVLLNNMVNTLVSCGVDRNSIENIDALDNVKLPIGNKMVKMNIKSQANGIIYMDGYGEFTGLTNAGFKSESDYGVVVESGSCWQMMRTSDRVLLSSVDFNGTSVPFDIAEKRAVSDDLSDKEALIIKSSGVTKTAVMEIPDGHYKEIYFVAMSAASNENSKADIKISYNGSEEIIAQPVYGYNKTYNSTPDVVKISSNGGRFEMPTWTWSAYGANNAYYVYKISTDDEKILENITFTAVDSVVAILGITGNLNVDATKASAESILAGGNDYIVENIIVVNNLVNTLVDNGVERSEIENIDALENVKIPVGNKYVNVDIKSQANGLIYMDSPADSHIYSRAEFTTSDFLAADGKASETWEAMLTSDRGKISSVEIDGKYVPFSPSPRRNGTNVNDKEAVVLRAVSGYNTYTVDIPDGCYEELYFVGMSTYESTATPTLDIEVLYEDGEKTLINQPVYGIGSTAEILDSAVMIPNGTRVEMLWWSAANDNYTLPSKYFAYKIPADSAKLLKSVNFTVNENATAIPAFTGLLNGDATISYLEESFSDLSVAGGAQLIAYNDIVNLLKNNGVDAGEIEGIEEFSQMFSKLYYVTDYNFKTDLLKWYAEINFSKPADESLFEENISVTMGDKAISFDTEPVYENGDCVGVILSAKHNLDFKSVIAIKLKEGLKSSDLTEIAAEWNASYIPEQLMEINSFTVTAGNEGAVNVTANVKCKENSEGKPFALFIGMYSKDNILLDYCVKTGVSEKKDVPLDINFTASEKGTYSFKCMLIDSYSTMALMDKVKQESVKIE